MDAYRKAIFENVVAYFACEFHDFHGYWPAQTWIYKFLALLDFGMMKKTGVPALGLEYKALENGPAPKILYDHRDNIANSKFKFEHPANSQSNRFDVIAEEPDMDQIPGCIVDEMDLICNKYLQEGIDLDDVIYDTHENIRAWRVAWEKAKKNKCNSQPMSFADEFEDDLNEIDDKNLTPAQDAFLFYEATRYLETPAEVY